MSPFHKPYFGIAIGAGLAVATIWCFKNVRTDESPRTQNKMQIVKSVGSLKPVAALDRIHLISAQAEASTDALSMNFEPDGISLNSDTLKANSSDHQPDQIDQIVLNATTLDNLSTTEVKDSEIAGVELDDQSSLSEPTKWTSEIVNAEKSPRSDSVVATASQQQTPVVNNLRESRKAPINQRDTASARVAITTGSSFNRNPYFNAAKNQPESQGLAQQTPEFAQGTPAVEMTELDSDPSQNNWEFQSRDIARKSSKQRLNSISNTVDVGLETKSPKDVTASRSRAYSVSSEAVGRSTESVVDLKDGISVLQFVESDSATSSKALSQLQFERIVSSPIVFANPPTTEQASLGRLSDAVTVRAVQHIEYGKTLARRGARASAKQEFMAALSMIAQDFDAQGNTNKHSQSLRRGTVALREAEEFITNDSESQIGMDVSSLIESHQCGALTKHQSTGLSPLQALQRYFGFAQLQIEQGVGKNVVSAEALYCLGRLHTLADSTGIAEGKLDRARAMVYHRASLNCDATNYRSANELGVLLAEFGELHESVDLLKESLVIRPTPATWENLAKVHSRLNQPELAQLATVEYQRAQANQSGGMIRWLEQNQFNAAAPPEVIIASNPTSNSETMNRPTSYDKQNAEAKSARESLPDRVKSWF